MMGFKLSGNFANIRNLDDLVKVCADNFKILENQQGPQTTVVQSATQAYPTGANRGDQVIDMTSQPYVTSTWNGLTWVSNATGSSSGSGSGTTSELVVADGVDNPPQIVYTDEGGDYIYSD